MTDYKVNIELSFTSKQNAESLMVACEPLLTQLDTEAAKALVDASVKELNEKATTCNRLIEQIDAVHKDVSENLHKANGETFVLRQSLATVESELQRVREWYSETMHQGECRLEDIKALIATNERTIAKGLELLNEFNASMEAIKKFNDTVNLVRDMLSVPSCIVAAGSIKLSENGKQVKGWRFSRE